LIVVDTSALIAVLRLEPEADRFLKMIAARNCAMSALSVLESSMVLAGRAPNYDFAALDEFIAAANIEVAAFDDVQMQLARAAYLRYGKGRHPAALNLGDCAAYALAKSRGLPLLYKGDDFTKTDILPPLAPEPHL
jgi:ribonuclease VapC